MISADPAPAVTEQKTSRTGKGGAPFVFNHRLMRDKPAKWQKLEMDVSPLKCSCVQTNCYCVLFTFLQRYMDRKQWVKCLKAFPFQTLSFRFTCTVVGVMAAEAKMCSCIL